MKNYIIGLVAVSIGFAACEKKVDPVDDFNVNVEFHNSSPKALTSDVTLNPKDSIYLDFTITSPDQDMAYVEIQKNGVRLDTFRLSGQSDKRTFSKVKGYVADSAAGTYTYRVLARDSRAVFIGDGGKSIKVTITPDFYFWSYRILQVPDTVEKTNKAYFSSSDGKTYSYSEGAAASSTIDFGYYWDTTGRSTSATGDDVKHSFYSLSAPQPQLGYYDISSWTKNVTLLKKLSINFNNINSSGAINTLVKNNMATSTSSKVTLLSTSGGSNVVGFKTAAGKYGAVSIRYVEGDSPAKTTYMIVDVKVQK